MGSTIIPLSWPAIITIIVIVTVMIVCRIWTREDRISQKIKKQYRGVALRQDDLIIDEHYVILNIGVSSDKYVIVELEGKMYPEDTVSRQFVVKFQFWYLPHEGHELLIKIGDVIKLNHERCIELVS